MRSIECFRNQFSFYVNWIFPSEKFSIDLLVCLIVKSYFERYYGKLKGLKVAGCIFILFFSSPVFWTGWTQWNSQTIFQWNRLVHWNWYKKAVTLKSVMGFCFGSFFIYLFIFLFISLKELHGRDIFWIACIWLGYTITLFFYWCLNPLTPKSSWQ